MRTLLSQWLSGKKAATVATYKGDLADFAAVAGYPGDIERALAWLFSLPGPDLNGVVLAYKDHLLKRRVPGRRTLGVAPATLNRRLAALRSFGKLARIVGYTTATIEISGVKVKPYRDTKGIGRDAYESIIELVEAASGAKAARDAVVLRFLHDLGLRRAELVRLQIDDVDLRRRTIRVEGKTGDEDAWPIGGAAMEALKRWLEHRGREPGPLVCSSRRTRGKAPRRPLDLSTVNQICRRWGAEVGERATPHKLRHTAITSALDATGGDVRRVASFSRHTRVDTVMIYDDRRRDLPRAIQEQVAAPARKK